jgi:hypothetical protein
MKKEKKKKLIFKDEASTKPESSALSSDPSEKYKYIFQNKAVARFSRGRRVVVALMAVLSATIVLGGAVYGMVTYVEYNNFKVLVDKQSYKILSLSNYVDFSNASEVLSLGGPKFMDNITLEDYYYVIERLKTTQGTYAADNFIAATFYLKNVSDAERTYREELFLTDVTKDIDAALRILIATETDLTVYAKPKGFNEDLTPVAEEVVPGRSYSKSGKPTYNRADIWMTVPFSSAEYVYFKSGQTLGAGETRRYSIMIWFEGYDEDTIDNKLGGSLKISLQFSSVL